MRFSTMWTMIKTGIILGPLALQLANAQSEHARVNSRVDLMSMCLFALWLLYL